MHAYIYLWMRAYIYIHIQYIVDPHLLGAVALRLGECWQQFLEHEAPVEQRGVPHERREQRGEPIPEGGAGGRAQQAR